MATNAYGDSAISDVGNGAIMVLVPDAPINLQDDPMTTSDSVIRFTWSDGASDGYQPIIDYRVSYDKSTGNWETLATVTDKFYQTTVALIAGQTYAFKVEARNTVGYSE